MVGNGLRGCFPSEGMDLQITDLTASIITLVVNIKIGVCEGR